MLTIILSLFSSARHTFQTRAALQAEILALRHQLLVLLRSSRGHRLHVSRADRFLWVWLARFWSGWRSALVVFTPETVIAWHRKGFRLYWKWKSRHPVGRPSLSLEVIDLIHRMSLANPRWGAPRIHGELLKLGCELYASFGCQVPGPPPKTAVAELAHVSEEPHAELGLCRFLRGSHDCITDLNAGQPSVPGSALSSFPVFRSVALDHGRDPPRFRRHALEIQTAFPLEDENHKFGSLQA
jgi:hypothetical protein